MSEKTYSPESVQLHKSCVKLENVINFLYYHRNEFLKNGFYSYAQLLEKTAIKVYVKYAILSIQIGVKYHTEIDLPDITAPVFLRSRYSADSAVTDIVRKLQFIRDIRYIKEYGNEFISKDLLKAIQKELEYPANNDTRRCIKSILQSMQEKCADNVYKRSNYLIEIKSVNKLVEYYQSFQIPELPANTNLIVPGNEKLKEIAGEAHGFKVPFVNGNYRRVYKHAFENKVRRTVEKSNVDLVNGEYVECMGSYAFNKCVNLKFIDMAMFEWQVFKKNTFATCTSLKTVDISNTTVVHIDKYCFVNCTSLSVVKLPPTLIYIGFNAFLNTKITHITIPATCIFCGYDESSYRNIGLGKKITYVTRNGRNEPKISSDPISSINIERTAGPSVLARDHPLYRLCDTMSFTSRNLLNYKMYKYQLKEKDIANLARVDSIYSIGEDAIIDACIANYRDSALEKCMNSFFRSEPSVMFTSLTDSIFVDTVNEDIYFFSIAQSISDTLVKLLKRLNLEKDDYEKKDKSHIMKYNKYYEKRYKEKGK